MFVEKDWNFRIGIIALALKRHIISKLRGTRSAPELNICY